MDLFKASVFSLLGVLLLFFLYPLLLLIYLGWGSLAAALSTGSFLQSLGLTVLISTAASLTAVILGIPAAYVLARYEFKLKELVDTAMDIPIVVPHTVVGLMVVLAFVAYGLGPSLNALGIKIVDALPGAVIAVSYLSATYAVRTVESAIRLLDPELENAARTLGAGPFRAFLSVVLPNIKSAVIDGAVLSWARSVSEAGALLVVAYYIVVGNTSIYPASIYIYQAYIGLGLDEAVKFSAALVLFVLGVFLAYRLAVRYVGAERS
ncbi:MAG: ABC transporter permease [Thermoproteus sp. JCHS_4]|jgi:ABC-type sulfate transport system, permease component|nr:MAG: ABC transporter permease [Thermoproteus sp. JCHS_4]